MQRTGYIVGMACLAFAPLIEAKGFEVGGLFVDVPARFEGPSSAEPNPNSKTYAFVVPSVTLSPSTVLQITTVDLGVDLSRQKGSQLTEISNQYLMQMLAGIERRRTEYRRSDPISIRLGGIPGVEATWSGKLNGLETNGVIFCVATGAEIIFLHVFGDGAAPNLDMAIAIKAVEGLHKTSG